MTTVVRKSNADGVRFSNEVIVKVLPKERHQMTSRERIKYWWSERELSKILMVCLKDLEIVKSEHEQSNTSVESYASSTQQSGESSVTARGLEYVYEDDERMKQKRDVVHSMVNLLNHNVDDENKKATKKFYKGAVKEANKRALLYGKLDELAVSSYLRNAEKEVQQEHQARATSSNKAKKQQRESSPSRWSPRSSPKSSKPKSKFPWTFNKRGGGSRNGSSTSASTTSTARTSSTTTTTTTSGNDPVAGVVDVATAAAIVAADAPATPSPRFRKKTFQPSVSEEGKDNGGTVPPPPAPPSSPRPSPTTSMSPTLSPSSRRKVSRQLRGSILSMASPPKQSSNKKTPVVVAVS